MSSNMQVAIREEGGFDTILKDVEVMQNMCAQLMKSKHYQVMGEAGIFAIVQKARSLNINPLEALNGGLYYINGKIGMSSEMMASLIRQAGHSIVKDPKSDDKICILLGKRRDNGDTWHVSFSMEDAKRAGLAKNMYDKYPAVMLYNRCMSMLARQLFPDVIKGAGYTHEELMEIKDSKENKISNFSPLQETTVEVIEEKKLITSEQVVQLQNLLKSCPKDYVANVSKYIADTYVGKGNYKENEFIGFDKIEDRDFTAIHTRIQVKLEDVEKANNEMSVKPAQEAQNAA